MQVFKKLVYRSTNPGLETSFWSSVFITSVGHTRDFGMEAKQLAGFSGLATGLGQILGKLISMENINLDFMLGVIFAASIIISYLC